MRQALWIFTLASAVVVAPPIDVVKAAVGPKDAIVRAREQISNKNTKAAATILEDALGASRGDDRNAILDLLKQTYTSLIREAQAAGETEDAALYADDLAILEAQPGIGAPAAPAAPPVVAATPTPSFEPTPIPEPAKAPMAADLPPTTPPASKTEPGDGASVPVPRSDKALDRVGFAEPEIGRAHV